MRVGEQLQKHRVTGEAGKLINVYFDQKAFGACPSRPLCTARKEKRIPPMSASRVTVEHVFGTIMGWMGATHFRPQGLNHVAPEISPALLVYNLNRAIDVAGVGAVLRAVAL